MTGHSPSRLLAELKRRRVFRVAAVYAVVAWIVIEAASVILPALNLPDRAVTLVVVLALLAFPLALVCAWAFDITPDGVKRADDVAAGSGRQAGRIAVVGAVLVLAIAGAGWWLARDEPSPAGSPDRKSIAVLPFTNLSAAAENAYFADGIHEVILTQLAAVEDLKVISRTSVMRYQGTRKSIREIGRELGVATVLEGSVQRAGGRVRITAQLIDATTDEHLWAQSYDRELHDVFTIQSEVATEIVGALEAELLPAERRRIYARPTDDIRAYDFYLRAREYHNDAARTAASYETAIRLYERAIAEDSSFALAYAGLSYVHSLMHWLGHDRAPARIEAAGAAVERALALDPDLPEAHLAKGFYHYYADRDYDAALDEFAVVRDGLPNSAEAIAAVGFIRRRRGEWNAAIENLERAVALDPRDPSTRSELGQTYHAVYRYEDAVAEYDRVLELAPDLHRMRLVRAAALISRLGAIDSLRAALRRIPSTYAGGDASVARYLLALRDGRHRDALRAAESVDADGLVNTSYIRPRGTLIGWIHLAAGDEARARAAFDSTRIALETALRDRPNDARLHAMLGGLHALLGDREAALRRGRAATGLVPVERDALAGGVFMMDLAAIHALLGETDRALDLLEDIVARPGTGVYLWLLRMEPRWAPIRDHPRFHAVLRRATGATGDVAARG